MRNKIQHTTYNTKRSLIENRLFLDDKISIRIFVKLKHHNPLHQHEKTSQINVCLNLHVIWLQIMLSMFFYREIDRKKCLTNKTVIANQLKSRQDILVFGSFWCIICYFMETTNFGTHKNSRILVLCIALKFFYAISCTNFL